MTRTNRHHTFYDREDWTRQKHLWNIRTTRGLILRLPMLEIHRPLHLQNNLRHGVPIPDKEAAIELVNNVLLPYEEGQPLFRTLEQAIGWFAMTDNQPTAEHLYEQKEFILGRLAVEEAA